jgi:hypothetical protein
MIDIIPLLWYYMFYWNKIKMITERIKQDPSDVQALPPNPEGNMVFERPISELPPVRPFTEKEGDEFWAQRKLRSEWEGGNYHNMPILGLGITYDGERAILNVPSKGHLNSVVKRYNPGGFKFVGAEGFEEEGSILTLLENGEFPLSENHTINTSGIPDTYLELKYGEDSEWQAAMEERQKTGNPNQMVSISEHDMVDHIGIAAIPSSEVQKLANLAHMIKIGGGLPWDYVAGLDRVLDQLSYYAILPNAPHSTEQAQLKDKLWDSIQIQLNGIARNVVMHNGMRMTGIEDIDNMPDKNDERYEEEFNKNFAINRTAYDEQIRIMQAIDPTEIP